MGADAVVGSTQRFGVPMGYGGHMLLILQLKTLQTPDTGRIIGLLKITKENQHIEWLFKLVNSI